jgi:hypothetical protein
VWAAPILAGASGAGAQAASVGGVRAGEHVDGGVLEAPLVGHVGVVRQLSPKV